MATIVERKGGWQAKVRRKGYEPQSRTFDTKTDAEKWARGIEHQMDRGSFVDSREAERTTLAEALERYEREVTPRKKGAKQERLRIALWRREPLARRSLANIRGADLAAWRDKRLDAGTSPTTVRNDLALLSHLFNTAIKEWGLESLSNPIEKIKMPSAARARDRRLVGDEETRLQEACKASSCPWLAPVTILALETAMRQGELLSLTWDNIDITRRVARLDDTKNGERRDVPLSTAALAVLSPPPARHRRPRLPYHPGQFGRLLAPRHQGRGDRGPAVPRSSA